MKKTDSILEPKGINKDFYTLCYEIGGNEVVLKNPEGETTAVIESDDPEAFVRGFKDSLSTIGKYSLMPKS